MQVITTDITKRKKVPHQEVNQGQVLRQEVVQEVNPVRHQEVITVHLQTEVTLAVSQEVQNLP